MGRIKIEDLPRDEKISKGEMRKVVGGFSSSLAQANLSSDFTAAPYVPGGAVLSASFTRLRQVSTQTNTNIPSQSEIG